MPWWKWGILLGDTCITQATDGGTCTKVVDRFHGNGGKWSWVLKQEHEDLLADWTWGVRERERSRLISSSVCVLSSWKDGLSLTEMGKTMDRADIGRVWRQFHTWMCYIWDVYFTSKRKCRSVTYYTRLALRGETQARATTVRVISRGIMIEALRLSDINTEMCINKDMGTARTELPWTPTDRSKIDGEKPAKGERW